MASAARTKGRCIISHVATVALDIKSLDDLDAACKRLGLELVRGQQTYHWYGRSVGDYPLPEGFTADDLGKCSHAIRIPASKAAQAVAPYVADWGTDAKPYEIGVVARRDGKPGFSLMWDFFEGGFGLENIVGKDCQNLRQAYAICAATRAARMQGMSVTEQKMADGRVRLVCHK